MTTTPYTPRRTARHHGPLTIRPAREEDWPAMEELLDHARRAYSGLGGAMSEALRESIVLAAWQNRPERERLAGFIMAFHQGPEAAWIHAMGITPEATGLELLHALEEHLLQAGISWIGYMDEYRLSWLRLLLHHSGFRHRTRVVGYEAPVQPAPGRGNPDVHLRPATAADMPAVAQLDRVAFGPLWAYRQQVLGNVLDQVACFLVAEDDGAPAGYILCTRYRQDHAHIVRLAVEPCLQGQGVGARLLAAAMDEVAVMGVRRISLNTQEENARSQHLYRSFGFQPTGDDIDVWAKEL